jgi:DNA polymerase-3 subunit alpha/error-prone DNA polymerase
MVCTINRFRRRSALREAAKAHGFPPEQIKALADELPYRWYGPPSRQESADRPFADLEEQYPAPHYQALFRDAAALLGLPRHLSIHPGVISPSATELVPLLATGRYHPSDLNRSKAWAW